MKLKEKKILAIILTITICISSMINTSICGATPYNGLINQDTEHDIS